MIIKFVERISFVITSYFVIIHYLSMLINSESDNFVGLMFKRGIRAYCLTLIRKSRKI